MLKTIKEIVSTLTSYSKLRETIIRMKSKKSQNGTPPTRAKRLPRPPSGEQFAVIREAVGGSRFMVFCADGKTRLMRVGGKFKKRIWVRPNDIVIVALWTIQTDKKCDLVYRYLPPERNCLIKNNKLPEELVI